MNRRVQISVDDIQKIFVDYDQDKHRTWQADIDVPQELIYALTDAQQAEEDALDALNDWAVQHGHEGFYSMVIAQNNEAYMSYQEQIRQEQDKRRKNHYRVSHTTVADR